VLLLHKAEEEVWLLLLLLLLLHCIDRNCKNFAQRCNQQPLVTFLPETRETHHHRQNQHH
jgi:hypothetical protein